MAIRLMSLRGVPDDELDDICGLFDKHDISYYITPPGSWHISAGAIWLDENKQLQQAHDLLNTYQQQRRQRAQNEFAETRQKGWLLDVIERVFENPVRIIGYLIIIGFILYISLMPFIDFGK